MSVSLPLAIGLLCGSVLGGLGVYLVLRYRAGGRSPAAVGKELDEYRKEVGEHFDKTSELFAAMTDQYRTLYEHLSTDARSLTGRNSIALALEASRGIIPGQKVEERIEDKHSTSLEPGAEERVDVVEAGLPEAEPSVDETGGKAHEPAFPGDAESSNIDDGKENKEPGRQTPV
jgi:uncharacterized membrane-anchored protein YhcB (DUF1043 family)